MPKAISDFICGADEMHYENHSGFLTCINGSVDIYVNVHDDFEIIYMQQGYARIYLDDDMIEISAGEAVIVNPRCIHFGFMSDDAYYYIFICKDQLGLQNSADIDNVFSEIVSGEMEFLSRPITEKTDSELMELFRRLIPMFSRRLPGWKLRITAEFYKFAAICLETGLLYKSETGTEHKIRNTDNLLYLEFFKYVSMHYGEKLSVQEIAAELGVSESKLYKVCKNIQSYSPVECILKYRLQRAAQLLKSSNRFVTDICYECGFGNVSYFISQFRKYYGITPHQFRKNTE